MTSLRVRRATIEDLVTLRSIWVSMRLPADELEKRLKEFQVVEADGRLFGAMGIQFSGHYALLHSEGFSDFSAADTARELFWDRVQTLAANHGVFRIWTAESSPFWKRWGFQPPTEQTLSRLPQHWKVSGEKWLTLQLKDEDAVAEALQTKFAGFMDSEKQQTARIEEKARALKTVIIAVGFGIFFICIGLVIYLLRHRNPFSE